MCSADDGSHGCVDCLANMIRQPFYSSRKACPYFAARSLAEQAELIFCPYNYLIDPRTSARRMSPGSTVVRYRDLFSHKASLFLCCTVIAKAMELDLTDAILILDEAHNIEDVSRDAGGLELEQRDLDHAVEKFDNMSEHPPREGHASDIEHTMNTLPSRKLRDVCQV